MAADGLADLAKSDYVERVNRAVDHVRAHLDGPLTLHEVAAVACFSPFHFHRVFKAMVGETLAAFVRRMRLERALYLVSHGPRRPLAEIALDCGFPSGSELSRAFRREFGVPPSAFDVEAFRKANRERFEATLAPPDEPRLLARLPPGRNPDGFVASLREQPARRVAYVRVLRPFEEGRVPAAAERLVAWARERGLEGGRWLGTMWEDPELVPLEDCRYDVGVEIPSGVRGGGEVGVQEFAAATLVEIEISGPIDLEQRALDWLYGTWLPSSGRVPAHQPGFEAWRGLPFEHGLEHFELTLQLAVERPAGVAGTRDGPDQAAPSARPLR